MYKYETGGIYGNEYRLYDTRTGETIKLLEHVAICLSYDKTEERGIRGTLLKHGDPDKVKEYYDATVEKMNKAGYREMANNMRYIEGKFNVDDLNKILDTTGYIGIFYEKLIGKAKKDPDPNCKQCNGTGSYYVQITEHNPGVPGGRMLVDDFEDDCDCTKIKD